MIFASKPLIMRVFLRPPESEVSTLLLFVLKEMGGFVLMLTLMLFFASLDPVRNMAIVDAVIVGLVPVRHAVALPVHPRHRQDLSGLPSLGAFRGASGDRRVALPSEAAREIFRTCGRVLRNRSPNYPCLRICTFRGPHCARVHARQAVARAAGVSISWRTLPGTSDALDRISTVPGPRCGSGGRLEHTGQHFAGGEQAAAMLPYMLDGRVGALRVAVTNGVFDQVNTVAAPDQAAGRVINTDLCDHTVKNDLAVAQQFQKRIGVGIPEHVNGLLLEDDLRIAAEVSGQIDLAVGNGKVVREERTFDLFLAGRAGEAVGWIFSEFGICLKMGIGRGDDRNAMLGSEGGEALEVRDDCFGSGHIDLPAGWMKSNCVSTSQRRKLDGMVVTSGEPPTSIRF